jgi:hypothetical protein
LREEYLTDSIQHGSDDSFETWLVSRLMELEQQKRQAQAMKALLKRVVEWDERFKHYPQSFIVEAKTLLGGVDEQNG